MKLKYKLPLTLFIAFVAVITLTFTVSLTNSARANKESQYEAGRSMAAIRAGEVKSFLENKITELNALRKNITAIAHLSDKDKTEILSNLLYAISDQPVVSDIYVTFERGAYFGADKTEPGRFYSMEVFLTESGERMLAVLPSESVTDDDEWYYGPKKTKKLHLTEPYEWIYPNETVKRKMFTLSVPIMANGEFIGMVGIDLQLDLMQAYLFDKMIDDKKGAYAILLSNKGLMVAHPKAEFVSSEIGEDMEAAERQALKDAIKNGSYRRVLKKSLNTGDFSLISYVPMRLNEFELPWSLAYAVSLEVVQAEAKRTRDKIIILGISCAVAWGVFLLLFMSPMFGNITRTVAALSRMTEGDGDLTVRLDERGRDEFGQMARGLNKMMEKLQSTIKSQHAAMASLEHARSEAEIANRSKSNFLAAISHEIRTPMNAIIGIAQIQLQRDDLPDDYAAALEKIYGSANNQLGIVNDILDMSKIETGKMTLNPIEYDTPSLINDAVQFNVVRIGSKPIEFIVDVDDNLPSRLYGDELRIKQILNNLLSNAIKYTSKGRVKLSVGYSADGDGVTLRFAVEDSGQGMKPEDKERLFSEYLRFNAEANRATEGTGLGLSITKRLVEMMDGTINVESEYGKGSVFTVTVRQKAVECPAIGAGVAEQLRSFAFTDGRRAASRRIAREIMPYGSVLVVDDVSTNLYVAEGLLSPYKLKVETAESGFEAIEKAEGGGVYDVIFMDHMMPRMDGIETMQKLRELGYTGAIVALTANAIVGNDEMFMQKGFDGFISKPIDVRQLDAVLNKFVRDKHPEEAKKYAAETAGQDESRQSGVDSRQETNQHHINQHGINQQHNGVDQYQQAAAAVERSKPVNYAANPRILKFFRKDAEKAIITLRETVKNNDAKLFTITAHAMKSALANVGENEASTLAATLESAGQRGDMGYISANVDGFIRTLESLINKFHIIIENADVGGTDNADNSNVAEDTDYLAEQLRIIKSACGNYDDDTAYAALDRLKEKRWKPSTTESLEKIRETLFVSSDFDGAAELCGAALMGNIITARRHQQPS